MICKNGFLLLLYNVLCLKGSTTTVRCFVSLLLCPFALAGTKATMLCCVSTPRSHLPSAGDQFALSEAVVALAMLMRRFEFSMDPEAPPVTMTTVFSHLLCSCLVLLLVAVAEIKDAHMLAHADASSRIGSPASGCMCHSAQQTTD